MHSLNGITTFARSVQVDPTKSDSDERSANDRAEPIERRDFLGSISTLAMAGGLAAGYGTFFVMAGRYLYPRADPGAWYFVARAGDIEPDGSIAYQSPHGVPVVVRRRAQAAADHEPTAEDFAALSSVCPHLGCRVHWEPHNDRFFCPCHNGVFDPAGRATAGPPKAANQSLPRYPLKVEHGLLFIHMPTQVVGPVRPESILARQGSDRREDLA
jgi:cytochrome b6-f complex iron-sulfur subunit